MHRNYVFFVSSLHLVNFHQVLHPNTLPVVVWPEYIRKRAQQDSDVVFNWSTCPLLKSFVIQNLGIVPIIALLLLVIKETLKLFLSWNLRIFYLNWLCLLLLNWFIKNKSTQSINQTWNRFLLLGWFVRERTRTSCSENVHTIVLRETHLSIRVLILLRVVEELIPTGEWVFIPIRLLKRNLLFIRSRISLGRLLFKQIGRIIWVI